MDLNLKDLVSIVPDFINLFLSGFIFMSTYGWLEDKKLNITLVTIWSLIISILIKSFYSFLHLFIWATVKVPDPAKIIVYSVTGFILAIIFYRVKHSKWVDEILYKFNSRTLNDNIFDDIIDYHKKTMMRIYIKSSNVYYGGTFAFKGKGDNGESWISLANYYTVKKDNNDILFDCEDANIKSSVAINMDDIEALEIIYEDDSETWKRIMR